MQTVQKYMLLNQFTNLFQPPLSPEAYHQF
jgi:hypothetical protein